MQTKLLIFDLWDTIVHVQDPHPVRLIWEIMGKTNMDLYTFSLEFERALMSKPFGSMKEAFGELLEEFCVEPTDEIILQISDVWTKTMNRLWMPEQIPGVLEHLGKKFKMGLLTNTDIFSYTYAKTKFEIAKYFDQMLASYEIGIIKPDKKAFYLMLEKFKVCPEECLMVGDNLFNDIVPAKKLNMKTLYIDIKNRIPGEPHADMTVKTMEQLIETLRDLK